MTAVTDPKTFADLFQDATKDPFGPLATAAKHAAYHKIYAYLNVDEDKGIVPKASATLLEVTHLYEAEQLCSSYKPKMGISCVQSMGYINTNRALP